MPSVIAYVEEEQVFMDHILELLQKLLVHLGQHQMFALLPAVVQLFLNRMEVELDVTVQPNIGDLQAKYKGFIQYLRFFATLGPSKSTQPLPLPVRDQVARIVAHLLKTLSEIPSSSDVTQQPQLSAAMFKCLFRRRMLTPELRKMLVGHAFDRKIDLTRFQWQQCTLSAMEERNDRAAKRYRVRWKLAIDREEAEAEAGQANAKAEDDEVEEVEIDAEELLEQAGIVNEEPLKSTIEMSTPTTSITERDKQISRIISEMVISQYSNSMEKILSLMKPYLTPSELDARMEKSTGPGLKNSMRGVNFRPTRYDVYSLLRYAWSILLDRCSKDKTVTSEALIEMAETLPGDAVVGHTLTPIMHGLVKRGEPLKAWEIWRDLIEREKSAPSIAKGLFVDRITLAVATEACRSAIDIDTAIMLVDTWGKKPTSRIKVKRKEKWAGSIRLDAQNINILLDLCRLDGKPSLAFRLWSAALPRYGVYLDDISMNLLLDIARYSDNELENEVMLSKQEENELFRKRLRAIAQEFRFRRKKESTDDDVEEDGGSNGNSRVYDDDAWANSPTSILLDNPNNAWRYRGDKGGLEAPWKKARRIFRQVILGNWPHLREVESPLEVAHQGAFSSIVSFFTDTDQSTFPPDPNSKAEDKEIHLPSPNARFTHIIPTSNTFRSYIALLGYYNRHSEIPIVLAWMKRLGITPTFSTMCLALLHICEAEGPRRWVKGFGENGGRALVRDEEIMRRWLQDWLEGAAKGRKVIVPTEKDVADSRRWLAERRQRLTA
ncbi:hypothetical protein I302_106921 [Kwoniella bestiolae CBS 10118]|uniref:Uncharacterized protein n=1 Tax=Kwoniella bestiolae CBS 10118 TaxID=1296100 RepID=A0A1B9G015_9TREE|nr:hypothetical protein I302_05813 [Kwoniella bestiolae CBS 10118]OCF24353.1 hypothetical protein I302_05813 [Kwoniella bestiolae CBS 10118]